MLTIAEEYRQAVIVGSEILSLTDQTPEQEQAVFKFKHKLVQALVTRIDVLPDKTTEVHMEFDIIENSDQALPYQSASVS